MRKTIELNLGRNFVVALAVFAAGSAAFLLMPDPNSSVLHSILDTCACLISFILALMLWNVGTRAGDPLPRMLAIAFFASAVFQLAHTIAALEALSSFVFFGLPETRWRAGTLGPTTHLLPLGIAVILWFQKPLENKEKRLLTGMLLLGIVLLIAFEILPRYTERYWLGIARPSLILGPPIWALVGYGCWRHRDGRNIMRALALMCEFMALANIAIGYSVSANDDAAMITHLGEAIGYIFLLVSIMQLAAIEMALRRDAEEALLSMNTQLEERVRERTAELQATNNALVGEASARQQADQRLQVQLDRLKLLDRITRSVAERQDMPSIFQVVIRCLEDQLPVDFACIGLYDAADQVITIDNLGVKSRPLAIAMGIPEQTRVASGENGLSRCMKGELVYEPDVSRVSFAFPTKLAGAGLKSLVIAPLIIEGETFGALIVARSAGNSFTSTDCEFVKQLCEHVSLAAQQAQLRQTLQEAYDDLRQSRQTVMQQERLRALGQMASGIAHDINNAISPMALHTQSLLETGGPLPPRIRSYLEIVSRVTDDVTATVARMREFYRVRDPQMSLEPVDLNMLVKQVVELTRARWGDIPQRAGVTIEMRTDLAANLPAASGVESEIREALTNLIFNAVDAMPQGGRLTVRSGAVKDGIKRVVVEVIDTGVGMDDETRRRCLEPFFTTKGERGTGLGLAMVYGVAQRHGAELDIDSIVGNGTTFRISFAMADPVNASPARKAAEPTAVPPSRILIVDDDPVILDSMRLVLELDGHDVTAANDGRSGVETFRSAYETGARFAVVITDLGMPYMDGHEVARAIKSISATTPVILLTGWGRRMSDEADLPANIDRTLDKPPKLPELREALANTLAMAGQ